MSIVLTVSPDGAFTVKPVPTTTAAAAPTPPPPQAAAAAPSDDAEPNWGFSKRLEAAFRALGNVPVSARALAAQGLGKESLTEEEFLRIRKSFQTLGKRIRRKLEDGDDAVEPVWVTVPGRRQGTTSHELAYRRKGNAKGVMS